MTKSRHILKPRRAWSAEDADRLRTLYPNTPTKAIAEMMGRSVNNVYAKAQDLGLKKTAEYLRSPAARMIQPGNQTIGVSTRFRKGHVPWTQGMRWTAPGRSAESRFKPGQRPHNTLPIGAERIADGYLQRKMTDTGYPPRDWVCVHRLTWEAANGPVPDGRVLAFRDGNPANIELDNLELIGRAEQMRRNTVHNLPPELVKVVQLRGALVRKINARSKSDEQ